MMVRWWAAFFIAGLVGPQGPIAGLGASISAAAATTWVLARHAALDERRFDGAAKRLLGAAAASFAIVCATAIIIWQAAGLQLDGYDRTWTRAPLQAKSALGAAGASVTYNRAHVAHQAPGGWNTLQALARIDRRADSR
jgi:hypothetical protein